MLSKPNSLTLEGVFAPVSALWLKEILLDLHGSWVQIGSLKGRLKDV
jgi:hypothetical protein